MTDEQLTGDLDNLQRVIEARDAIKARTAMRNEALDNDPLWHDDAPEVEPSKDADNEAMFIAALGLLVIVVGAWAIVLAVLP